MNERKLKQGLDMLQKEISEILALRGWNRADLAKLLGISVNLIDRWFCPNESARRPLPEYVEKIHKILLETREQKIREWAKEGKQLSEEVRTQPA